MALAMNHHNAYLGGDNASVPSYRGDGNEPPPAPSVRELVERSLQGRIDSDPEVNIMFFFANMIALLLFSDILFPA